MTWSIIARHPETGAFGIAVATRFFAVGALCPTRSAVSVRSRPRRSSTRPTAPRGLRMLREGTPARTVVEVLIASDDGRATRQLHVQDADRTIAAHTGDACVPWCGHTIRSGFSVAGNMLTGPQVIAETARVYQESATLTFPRRLIAALRAGEAAGGDKRGKQSAALVIYTTEEYPALDLRVDDHADPLADSNASRP